MSMPGEIALILANQYTKDTVQGMGALQGEKGDKGDKGDAGYGELATE